MSRFMNHYSHTVAWIAAVLVCMAVATSCATSTKVVTDYDSSADVSVYRTYAWTADTPLIAAQGSEVPVSMLNVHRIETAIERELGDKGYTHVELNETPCFVVSFTVGAHATAIPSRPTHRGVLYGRWSYYGSPVDTYQVELLGVDILDGPSKQIVWHATATRRMTADPESAIGDAAHAIIAQFPPAA